MTFRTRLAASLILLAVPLTGCGTATAGKEAPGDDQRIEAAVREFYGLLSEQGPGVAVTKACATDRAEWDALPDTQKSAAEMGKLSIRIVAVEDIVITGDRATATMTGGLALPGAEDKNTTATEHLRKEEGAWKVCSADGK
ncbi:Rv0361 family membrane protein [Nocardia sp. IFM 10818]